MEYFKNNLKIKSDFDIKSLDKFEEDIDLIISLDSRVVNLILEDLPDYIINRFQLTEVKSILIRHSVNTENNTLTVHFLRVIDLNSSLMNFSLDYTNFEIIIKDNEYSVDFIVQKRGEDIGKYKD